MTLEAYVLADKARGVPRGDISSQQGWMRKFWVIGLEVDFFCLARPGEVCFAKEAGCVCFCRGGRTYFLAREDGGRVYGNAAGFWIMSTFVHGVIFFMTVV